jgi:hypothetical protein
MQQTLLSTTTARISFSHCGNDAEKLASLGQRGCEHSIESGHKRVLLVLLGTEHSKWAPREFYG